MRHSRKTIVAAASAFTASTLLRYPGDAAETTFKFALNMPVSHPTTVRAVEAAKKIEQESGGRLEVQTFPDMQLGNDTSMLAQLRTGAVQLYSSAGGNLAAVVPVVAIEGIAFAFTTLEQAYAAMDSPLGAYLNAAVEKAGIYAFGRTWCAGFHHVATANHPIVVPDDLRGLKVRVPPAPLEVATFKSLGASPQAINLAETYTALQTHLVDAVVNPLAAIETFKMYEVQKYLSLTRHLWGSFRIIANADAMRALAPKLREIVDRNVNAAGLRQRADMAALETTLEKTLAGQGMIVNRPEIPPFRAALHKTGIYEQWRTQFGAEAWTLLEKAVGPLA